jgi:DNA/RNA endonuclease YhcR with UshA esterase domain
MSHCSSCGKYVGPYQACPYCGARQTGRTKIRTIKAAAAVLATVGLIALWLAATRAPIPLIQVGQAEATMSMAYARVEGHVVRGPTYYADSGYLAFSLRDSTGEIRVSAYANETAALRALGLVPALGDWVSVAGTLQVRQQNPSLTINVPEHLTRSRPEASIREIGAISPADHLLRVRVRGQVWSTRQPYDGLTIISLRDPTGLIDVTVTSALEELTGALLPLQSGQSVEVAGAIDLYQDIPQLVPASTADVVLLPEPIPIARQSEIGSLAQSHVGQLVTIEGRVSDISNPPVGIKLHLEDGSGRIAVLIWQDLVQEMAAPEAIEDGVRLSVTGEVSLYNDQLELLPARSIDIQELGAGPLERADAPTPIGGLATLPLGETATVQGAVTDVETFASGLKFTLDDGTGQVVLLLWFSIYQELEDPRWLEPGALVLVTGVLEQYAGQLQLVPARAQDLQPYDGNQ